MTRQSKTARRTSRPARGVVLIVVIVLLILITGLAVAWTQRVLLHHRQISQRQLAVQADWLAQSALQRAIAQIVLDEKYQGETWRLTAADLQSSHDATVEIQITPSEEPDLRQIEVLVDYPEDPLLRNRVQLQQQLKFPSTED